MLKRYQKNMNMLSAEDIKKVNAFKVCVIGCGGLGGHIVESLARLGVETITAVDKDVFDETNYNRQIYANAKTMGFPKAAVTRKFIKKINDRVNINTMTLAYNERMGRKIIRNHDLVVDAVDNVETKLLLEEHCEELNLPLVHGAIGGWYGQLGICMPGSKMISKIYGNNESGAETELGNPSFTPAIAANLMVAEILKFILGKDALINKLMTIDLIEYTSHIVEFKSGE